MTTCELCDVEEVEACAICEKILCSVHIVDHQCEDFEDDS